MGEDEFFPKGSALFAKGARGKGLYFLKNGTVGLIGFGINGDDTLLRVFGANSILGYRSLLRREKCHATALALSNVSALFFPVEDESKLLFQFPELFMFLSRTLAADLRTAEERLRNLSGRPVLFRVVESLVYLKQSNPDYLWTRREIGEFCGVRTETVTRALGKLETKGLIKREGREVKIIDFEALAELSREAF